MAVQHGVIAKLSAGDAGENGVSPAAQEIYQKLKVAAESWNDGEIAFVNAIRALYRSGHPFKSQNQLWGALAFTGANVRIKGDGGLLYANWLALASSDGGPLDVGMRTGTFSGSSHKSDEEQYEVKLKGAGAILIGCGTYPELGSDVHTWFQSEKFPATASLAEKIGHTMTFFEHAASGFKQVGKFGNNPYSEKKGKPVVVEFTGQLQKQVTG